HHGDTKCDRGHPCVSRVSSSSCGRENPLCMGQGEECRAVAWNGTAGKMALHYRFAIRPFAVKTNRKMPAALQASHHTLSGQTTLRLPMSDQQGLVLLLACSVSCGCGPGEELSFWCVHSSGAFSFPPFSPVPDHAFARRAS